MYVEYAGKLSNAVANTTSTKWDCAISASFSGSLLERSSLRLSCSSRPMERDKSPATARWGADLQASMPKGLRGLPNMAWQFLKSSISGYIAGNTKRRQSNRRQSKLRGNRNDSPNFLFDEIVASKQFQSIHQPLTCNQARFKCPKREVPRKHLLFNCMAQVFPEMRLEFDGTRLWQRGAYLIPPKWKVLRRRNDFIPFQICSGACLTETLARDQMTLHIEMVVDGIVDGQKTLHRSGQLEPAHTAFSSARRLM